MQKRAGNGWEICKDCINAELDPFQCRRCKDGSKFEGADDTEELTVHDLKFIRFEEIS